MKKSRFQTEDEMRKTRVTRRKMAVILVLACMGGLAYKAYPNCDAIQSKASELAEMTSLAENPDVAEISESVKDATKVTNSSIQKKEDDIAQAKKEKENLKSKITDLEKLKKNLEKNKSNLEQYVKELEAGLEEIQANIDALTEQISAKETEIETTQANIAQTTLQLKESEDSRDKQQDDMSVRMRRMYEKGNHGVFEALLQAKSLQGMLNQADYIEKVVSYDRKMWENLKETVAYIELCKRQLELEEEQLALEESILEESKAAVETEKAAMAQLKAEKEKQIAECVSELGETEEEIAAYEKAMREATNEIAALEKALAAEMKALEGTGQSTISYNGGKFCQPLESYTRISDDYGERIHPILNTKQFHNGVDFAAGYGTAIYAAYDGKVVSAAYSKTMGNYVMINHGDGLITIYMHASSLNVSTGDTVKKGDKIGGVGSTGRSTGNHLHFSVRLNGNYVSPWNYLSK